MYAYRAWFEIHRALTLLLLGRPSQAIPFFLKAWAYGTNSPPAFIPAQAAGELALIYSLRGDYARAELWLGRYHTTLADEPEWIGYLAGMAAHLALALRAIDHLDAPAARLELDRLGDGSAPVELWPWVVYINAQYGLQFGHPATALANLETAVNAHDKIIVEQASPGCCCCAHERT
jgi:LuxR family maltose regulon positive regulatory protein